MNKNFLLLDKIVNKYHPSFKHNSSLRKLAIKNPTIFNVERLIEETLAAVGGLDFVDEAGYDFLPDYSDSKTVTINCNSRIAEISGVQNKIGALRVVAYNSLINRIDYFFLRHCDVLSVKEPSYGKNSFKERIRFTYSLDDHYSSFENFRVDSFEQLSSLRD